MYLELASYARPATVAAALSLLAEPGSAALAGGTRLNVHGHERLRAVVDLQALPLEGVTVDSRRVRLGALTPIGDVLIAGLPAGLAALTEAVAAEKNLAIRNRSTLGGRVSRDRSDARLVTALLALGAEVELALAGPDGSVLEATRPLAERVADIAAGRASGLVAGVLLPSDAAWSAYQTVQLTAVDAPMTDAALAVTARGLAIATGVHGPGAAGTVLLPEAAARVAALTPADRPEAWRPALRELLLTEIPAYTDALVSGDYRRDLAATLVLRLVDAWLASTAPRGAA